MSEIRGVKLVGAVAAVLGVLYLSVGVWGLVRAKWAQELIDFAQFKELPEAAGIDLSRWGPAWVGGMAATTLVGVVILVAAVGLLRRRDWGRRIWLSVLVIMVALHVLWGVADGGQGRNTIERLFELVGVLSLAVFSWIYFSKLSVRTVFSCAPVTAEGGDGTDLDAPPDISEPNEDSGEA
ncbi:MAG: hypothetical protein GY906_06955 [bacterium]|nr:hypothetical protein [bacterium]